MHNFDISSFPAPGLYLLFSDGNRIDLTHKKVEEATQAVLADPNAIPKHVRAATDYKPCDICPERDSAVICHAIMPTIPFFDDIDRYMSYDEVTAVYRENESETIIISETKMSEALKFIAILGLTDYCEVGHKYLKYFDGVNPMMPADEIGKAVFKNILFELHGHIERMQQAIHVMSDELLHTAKCQVARLNLICKRDAFVNAYVNTDLITSFLKQELKAYISSASNPL